MFCPFSLAMLNFKDFLGGWGKKNLLVGGGVGEGNKIRPEGEGLRFT